MASKMSRRHAPPSAFSYRKTLQGTDTAKVCYFYKDGDHQVSAIKIPINPRYYRSMKVLYDELSVKVKMPYGVRRIFTPQGRNVIPNIEGFQHGGHYVCSTRKTNYADGIDPSRVAAPVRWNRNKPSSGQRDLNSILHDPESDDPPRVKQGRYAREQRMAYAYNRSQPKKITVLRNGDPTQRHILLLNRRTAQTFEQILSDVSEMFQCSVERLCTLQGRKVMSLTQLFNGPDALVAAAVNEPFKRMVGLKPHPPAGQPRQNSRSRSHFGGDDFVADKLKNRRDRLLRTKGYWKVWVTTNELATAGTTAQVTLTVYGHRGQTTPLPLGFGDGQHFQNGHIDEFDVNVGSIGEVYKVRVGHDNTGDFPSWLCDEVRMQDKDTGEELVFPVRRWMAREEDDRETCREIPAVRRGDPQLPVMKYEVTVVTGNLWNAGTEANVYLTVYGDRGDTGVRQLYATPRNQLFKKGQTDHFTVEAVSLGKLKRVIVGHDGTSAGEGWFLEKIMIQEPDAKPHEVYTFHCNKWLDEGEDDGKIVRELKVQDEYMEDILAKRNRSLKKLSPRKPKFDYKNVKQWEFEKWKFDNKNQVMFFSMVTGKALRIKSDGSVDGLGEESDAGAIFTVSSKKPMVRIFTSLLNQNFHLAIDNGKIVGHGRGGPYCEFRIHVQTDCTVMLEGVKNPLQFVSLLDSGKLGDPRGVLDREPGKRFYVYCKGMTRHRGIIMLKTSNTQAINVDHDLNLFGTGKCHRGAHFRVHKVDRGGIRLLESMVNPGKYLRLFDGKIDCQGKRDDKSHFIMKKHRDKGYITVESKTQRGIFLGLTPKGEVRPTVDTGVNNIWLFPEVIEFGVSRKNLADDKLTPISEHDTIDTQRSLEPKPQPKKKQKSDIAEGDWRVTLNTVENLENGHVALVVYGDKGHSGSITLTPPVKNGPAFRAGCSDDFKVNLLKVGHVYKIRLELVSPSSGRSPSWKVGHVKMVDLLHKDEMMFRFDRWLSRYEDDGDTMRELPAIRKGKEVLPVRKYEVRVYTGKEDGAETRSAVHLNLFGEHGDFGKRMLLKSNNKVPFLRGQVDKFEIEAVSLGQLTQCLVGHDGTRSGDGWYLDTIVVRESKNSREYTFPCKKWLDSGREDRKIERLLPVKETSDSKPPSDIIPMVQQKQKTPTPPPPQEEKPEPGTWRLLLTTGREADMGCLDSVVMYAYGSRGSVGPILIGHGQDGVFQPGNTDEFKVKIDKKKTGMLYKIRVGLAEKTFGAHWFLEKLIMVDLVDGETLEFRVHRWLSRKHDDCDVWRELPVTSAGEAPLPVHVYQLQVQTGDYGDAETEAEVFVTVFGERGDSGQRRLFRSKSEGKPFTKGKVDVFTLEAVSLGPLSRLVVGHSEKKAGEGWYLTDIAVSIDNEPNNPPTYFPCNRWLDSGKDDRKIEVELVPGEKPQESKGEYQVWVKTAPDSSPANGGKVSVALYGSQGHSKDIELYAHSNRDRLFEPGNIDEFEAAFGQIGEIQKLRVNREDTPTWKSWHLDEIRLKDKETGQIFIFAFDRWFSRDMDDHDLVRELPALKNNKPVGAVCHYEVTTFTGDHWAGGTDAAVHITLIGSKGDSGKRALFTPADSMNVFDVAQEDTFNLEAVDLGDLTSVVIGHTSKGHGAGWFLDKVVVKVKSGDGGKFVFPCMRWLDAGENDGKIERELRQIDVPDLLQIAPMSSRTVSTGDWEVYVRTSDIDGAATCAQVYLTVYGSKDISPILPLGDGSPTSDNFWRGKEAKFKVNVGKVGEIKKIRLEHDNRNPDPAWHVESVRMVDIKTEEELFFPVNRWLAENKEDGQLYRECPVVSPGVAPVPVLRYLIAVQTGRQRSAGASEGWISVRLTGRQGDTGQQLLQQPLTSSANKMSPGKLDVYVLEAVSVGTLQSLRLVFEGHGRAQKWLVERVLVLESLGALEEAVFDFNCWLDVNDNNAKEVPLTGIQASSFLTDDMTYRLLGRRLPESEGRWEASIWTASSSDAGTKDTVLMVLYGTTGHTEPKPLNKDYDFNPGSVVKLQIDTGRIGPLFKIRLMFEDRSGNSSWTMERLKLKDLDTDQEFHFDQRIQLESSPQTPDGATELAAIRPDITPLPETTYLVTVNTGTQERAETEAEISCTLIGRWGDTGERMLTESKSYGDPFQKGKTDEFELKGLYLGDIRKILIGHNENGRGSGWFCQQVTVRPLDPPPIDKKAEVVFACNRWLDSGCEDRRLMRELTPAGCILPPKAVVDKSVSKGVWRCSVSMAGEDQLDSSLTAITLPEQVSIVVYGTRGVKGPLRLQDSNRDLFLMGQTDTFEDLMLGDIGDVRKLRVCAGREDDDNPVWMVQQVTLEDVHSREVLHFDFSRWVGQVGGDIQHELPVLLPGYQAPAVVQYEVTVQTEHGKEAGTNAAVFINLYGKNGDSGRRRLVKPAPRRSPPFQAGQSDVFVVEAVDLGDLEKVVVTKGPGRPWQLSQVKVRPGLFSALTHVFIWSNAVGNDRDEMKEVEITIPVISSWPAPVAIPADQLDDLPASGGQWLVEVLTGDGGVSGEGMDLVLVMCGDKGESSPIRFHFSRDRHFQPRQADSAEVHLAQDVGDLIKVRLGFADNSKHKSLDIARIKFEDTDTHDNFSYDLNAKIEVTESKDGWKEFPVIWPAVHILPVVKYRVEITTGGVPNSDTKAQVYIQLHGRMGSTGKRQLKKSLNNDMMFQMNQTDRFELEAVSLMSVDKVTIGHHSAKAGEGWFLKRVVVIPQREDECVFECNRWLDGGEDDGRIERTLNLMDEPGPTPRTDVGPPLMSSARDPSPTASRTASPVAASPPPREKAHKWRVWTTTGSKPDQGTNYPMALVLYGDKGHTEPMKIGTAPQDTFRFKEGKTQDFKVETDVDVGEVYKARVGLTEEMDVAWYSDLFNSPSWFLERLKIQDMRSNKQYVFEAHKWVRVDEHHDHWREFPVYHRDEKNILPVRDYYVEVFTGDEFGAGTDANVYLQIFGDRGDTGKRHLHGTRTPGKMFENGMHDVFSVEAVDLGSLRKVIIGHDGEGMGSGWFLDSITIKESQNGKEKFVFNCGRWLDVDEDDGAIERELPLSGVVKVEPQGPRAGDWKVLIMTSIVEESGTDAKVTLTVFGDKGNSGSLPLGAETVGCFQTGHTDEFDIYLDPEEVGKIEKIRLEHDNSGQTAGWRVEKMIMTNSKTGDKLEFVINCWLSFSEKHGDIVFEAAAEWPNEQPLPKYKYLVKTVTPDESNAGTNADVHLTLVGSRGDSGRRELKQNLEDHTKFQPGTTDSFVIEAVDLGRLEKLVVGLNGAGFGSSWKLQCVVVRVPENESFVFPWGKFLNDETPEAEIPLAEIIDDYTEAEIVGQTPRTARQSPQRSNRSPQRSGRT